MKKLFKIALVIIPIGFVILLIAGYLCLNSAVKKGIGVVGPKLTKTAVSVESVKLSPFSGRGELRDLFVGNPDGFKSSSLFELGRVVVDIDLTSVMSDCIVVNEIIVESPVVTYERSLRTSNIKTLLETIEAISDPASSESSPEPAPDTEGSRKIRIDKFIFQGGTVRFSAPLLQGQSIDIPLPNIELTDIGKASGGTDPASAFKEIIRAISQAATNVVGKSGALLKDNTKALSDAAKKTGSAVTEEASKVLGGVKNLFK